MKKFRHVWFGCAALTAIAATLSAQSAQTPANPLTTSEKGLYDYVTGVVIAAAEKMPEENYSFKATPEVRSFGEIVGHIAGAQQMFCATAAGEKPAMPGEKSKTSKADLVQGLKDAKAACDKVYSGMTDAQAGQMANFMGHEMTKLSVLSINTAHTDEHYGNLVTYMRLKGIVPPSSENRQGPPSGKDTSSKE